MPLRRLIIPHLLTAVLVASAAPAISAESPFALRGLSVGMRGDEIPTQVDRDLLPTLRVDDEALILGLQAVRLGDDECASLYQERGFSCLTLLAVLTHPEAPVTPPRVTLIRMQQNYQGAVREVDFEARLFEHYGQPDHIHRGRSFMPGGTRPIGYLWAGENPFEFREKYIRWLETGLAMTEESRPPFEKPYLLIIAGAENDTVIGIEAVSVHPGYNNISNDPGARETEALLERRRREAAGEVRF